jgi:DNA polymerase III epsilon subunit-like protein
VTKLALVFDCETTGLPKHPDAPDERQPRIIEWAGALVDVKTDRVVEEYEVLINPGQKLEAIITKITDLTDADLADKPKFPEVADEIRALFAQATGMVAHNLPFDAGLLTMELARAKITEWPWPEHRLCTVQETAEEWGRRARLKELYEHITGHPLAQKHRALDDVHALVEVAAALGVWRGL